MKSFSIALTAAAARLLAGCTKKSLPSITLSSDKEEVSVTTYNNSIAFTLNHIWLQDHSVNPVAYPKLEEEDVQMPIAAEPSSPTGD